MSYFLGKKEEEQPTATYTSLLETLTGEAGAEFTSQPAEAVAADAALSLAAGTESDSPQTAAAIIETAATRISWTDAVPEASAIAVTPASTGETPAAPVALAAAAASVDVESETAAGVIPDPQPVAAALSLEPVLFGATEVAPLADEVILSGITIENATSTADSADDVTILSGGKLIVNGSSLNTVISGGSEILAPNASASGTVVSGGLQAVESAYAYDTQVYSGGTQLLLAPTRPVRAIPGRGNADNTVVHDGGVQIVSYMGVATNTVVSSGGALRMDLVMDYQSIYSNESFYFPISAYIYGATIHYGGLLYLSPSTDCGLFDTITIGGEMQVRSAIDASGAELIWDLSERGDKDNTAAMVDNFANLTDLPDQSISILADQAWGTYVLAGGVADGVPVNLIIEGFAGTYGTFDYSTDHYNALAREGNRYDLYLADSTLSFRASERYIVYGGDDLPVRAAGATIAVADMVLYQDYQSPGDYRGIFIAGQDYGRDIFGGSLLRDMTGKISLEIRSGALIGASSSTDHRLFAGASTYSVGETEINILDGAVVSGGIFAGSYNGNVGGSAAVNISNATIAGSLFGGGFAENGSDYVDAVEMAITGGAVSGNLYGGGYAEGAGALASVQLVNITISGGNHTGTVYGGGLAANGGVSRVMNTVNVTLANTSLRNYVAGGKGSVGTALSPNADAIITEIEEGTTITGTFVGGVLYDDPSAPVPSVGGNIVVRGGGTESAPVSITGDFTGGSRINYNNSGAYPDGVLNVNGNVSVSLSNIAFTGYGYFIVMGGRVSGVANAGSAGGMVIADAVTSVLTNVTVGNNNLVLGAYASDGGQISIGGGVDATLDNVTFENQTFTVAGAMVEGDGSVINIINGLKLKLTNSTILMFAGTANNQGTGGQINVNRAQDEEYAVDISFENTVFEYVMGVAAAGTVQGVRITVDAASKGLSYGYGTNAVITGVGYGFMGYATGKVVIDGDLVIDLYDDSCQQLYAGWFSNSVGDEMWVENDILITVRAGADQSDMLNGIISIYGGIRGTYLYDQDNNEYLPSAGVKGKISINVEGRNISDYTAGGSTSVGEKLTGGTAIETIITGDLKVHGLFVGGVTGADFPITINGDITVGVKDGVQASLEFSEFIGGFMTGWSYGEITIKGQINITLSNAQFTSAFTGGGMSTGQRLTTVEGGISVTLTNAEFINEYNSTLRQVIGVRVEGGTVNVLNGVTGNFTNVRFVEGENNDPERPYSHKLFGGAFVQYGEATIDGGVNLTLTDSKLEMVYCGGYSRELFITPQPSDNDNPQPGDEAPRKAVHIKGNATGVAVQAALSNTSFTTLLGGGQNIEVDGDIVLTLNNGSKGNVLYGSGSNVWQVGDVYITVDGGSGVTDRLVGGGGGTEEIVVEVYNEVTGEYENISYGYTGYIDGSVRISLTGGGSFGTVYGGSDFQGIAQDDANPPAQTRMSSSDPGSDDAHPGRPTEIYHDIHVVLGNVTIKNYIGAGLGSVGVKLPDASVAVLTEFTQATLITDSFIGGSYYYSYLQDDPTIYGDIRVEGGATGAPVVVGGEFHVGSKVTYTETEIEKGYWDIIQVEGAGGYEWVGYGNGDYTVDYYTGVFLPVPGGYYVWNDEAGQYEEATDGNGTHDWYSFPTYNYTPGTGSYNFNPDAPGDEYIFIDPVYGAFNLHTVKGSVTSDLTNVSFTGSGLTLTGGGFADGAGKNVANLIYKVEGGTDIRLTDAAFNSNMFVGGLHVVNQGYATIAGTVKTALTNATFGATSLTDPALILGAYALSGAKAEVGGVTATLTNVDLSARSGSVIYAGNAASGGGNADLTGDISLTIAGVNGKYGTVYGGSGKLDDASSANVTGNITLSIRDGYFAGNVYGGSYKASVDGNISLTFDGTFAGNIYGGGFASNTSGRIDVTYSGLCATAGSSLVGGGLGGNVGVSGQTGVTVRLTINAAAHASGYHIIAGTDVNSSVSGDSTIYGDVELNIISKGVNDDDTVTGVTYGGSRRNGVAGTSLITGKTTLNLGAVTINNLVFGGGYANGASVRSEVAGGVVVNLNGTANWANSIMAGGRANGANAVSAVGTAENKAGVQMNLSGATRLYMVHAGGYATSGGLSEVYGNATITIADALVYTGLIFGGGYAYAGKAVTYGKALINVSASARTDYIYGGGYSAQSGITSITEGTEINLTGFNSSTVIVFGGGRTSHTGISYIGAGVDGTETAGNVGSNITIDADTTVRRIYGGGGGASQGRSIVYGGTHVTVNGGSVIEDIYGGGYVDNTVTGSGGSFVYGGTNVVIKGGSARAVFGGGNTHSAISDTGHSVVYGGTHVTIDTTDVAFTITGTSNGGIFGGGGGTATVYGGSLIEFTGKGENLNLSTFVWGTNMRGNGVDGNKELKFNAFSGDFSGRLRYFDTITINGSSVNWVTAQNNLADVSTWNFDLLNGTTALDWLSGSNDFNGDTLNLKFDSSDFASATVIAGGNASVINGWQSFSSVTFNGIAGRMDEAGYWVSNDSQWKLALGSNNDLILSKLV